MEVDKLFRILVQQYSQNELEAALYLLDLGLQRQPYIPSAVINRFNITKQRLFTLVRYVSSVVPLVPHSLQGLVRYLLGLCGKSYTGPSPTSASEAAAIVYLECGRAVVDADALKPFGINTDEKVILYSKVIANLFAVTDVALRGAIRRMKKHDRRYSLLLDG